MADLATETGKYVGQSYLAIADALVGEALSRQYPFVQSAVQDKIQTDAKIDATLSNGATAVYNFVSDAGLHMLDTAFFHTLSESSQMFRDANADQYRAQINQASTHSNTDYPPLIDGRSTTLRSYEAVIDAKDAIIEHAAIYADNAKDFLNQNNRGEHAETLPGAMLNTLSYVSDPFLGSAAGLAALSESIAGLATKAYQGLNAAQIARIKAVAQELVNFPKSTLEAGLNSFSHKASEILKEVGLTMEEFLNIKNTLVTDLSRPQIRQLKTIRNSIPMPTENTLLQKVIPEADIAKYLSGKYTNPSGYIARADDISHAKKMEDVIESLRLDYPNTPFTNENGYGVIRFKASKPETIEIPFGTKLGGKNTDGLPCTLNGFTACRNGHIIPEFKIDRNIADLPQNGAELLHVDKNGVEKLMATFGEDDNKVRRFIPEK